MKAIARPAMRRFMVRQAHHEAMNANGAQRQV
jgi:hypothetical protein